MGQCRERVNTCAALAVVSSAVASALMPSSAWKDREVTLPLTQARQIGWRPDEKDLTHVISFHQMPELQEELRVLTDTEQ